MDWNLNLRAVERLLIALSGTLCIYLGYSLFIKGVSGKASLRLDHNKSKLQLANAAPGIFFALFGAAILLFTMWKSVTVDYLVPLATKQTPGATFPRLPFSNGEPEAVGNMLRQQNSDVQIVAPSSLDPSKLSEKLKSGEYVILHFATHGVLAEPTKPRGDLTHGQDKQQK